MNAEGSATTLRAGGEEPLRCTIDVDTSSAPPAEQFDLFRSWYAGIAEVELLQEEARSFPAHQKVWCLEKLTILDLKVPDCRYGWRHLSKPVTDDWFLNLPRPQFRNPGDNSSTERLRIQSLFEPSENITEKNDYLTLFIPRDLVFNKSSKIETREDSKQFLADYMLLLHRTLPILRNADVPHIAAATTSLLAACLAPSRDHIAEAQRPIEAVIMNRASKFVAKHLADPKLTPDMLCNAIGVSRSGLYRIFEPVGGISTYIRRERLRKMREALMDSSDGRPISTIAEQWGFINSSTFSRMFKKEFGISPREARAEDSLHAVYALATDTVDGAHALRTLLIDNTGGRIHGQQLTVGAGPSTAPS